MNKKLLELVGLIKTYHDKKKEFNNHVAHLQSIITRLDDYVSDDCRDYFDVASSYYEKNQDLVTFIDTMVEKGYSINSREIFNACVKHKDIMTTSEMFDLVGDIQCHLFFTRFGYDEVNSLRNDISHLSKEVAKETTDSLKKATRVIGEEGKNVAFGISKTLGIDRERIDQFGTQTKETVGVVSQKTKKLINSSSKQLLNWLKSKNDEEE